MNKRMVNVSNVLIELLAIKLFEHGGLFYSKNWLEITEAQRQSYREQAHEMTEIKGGD